MTIEASHYQETRDKLTLDPVVQEMAAGILMVPIGKIAHPDGKPRWDFMQQANQEYGRRGGTTRGHIGAVAEAILAIRSFTDATGSKRTEVK